MTALKAVLKQAWELEREELLLNYYNRFLHLRPKRDGSPFFLHMTIGGTPIEPRKEFLIVDNSGNRAIFESIAYKFFVCTRYYCAGRSAFYNHKDNTMFLKKSEFSRGHTFKHYEMATVFTHKEMIHLIQEQQGLDFRKEFCLDSVHGEYLADGVVLYTKTGFVYKKRKPNYIALPVRPIIVSRSQGIVEHFSGIR